MPKHSFKDFKWSWTAGAPVIITILLAVIATPPADTMAAFYRSAILDILLVTVGILVAIKISEQEQERDRLQAEMITGGENFCFLTVDRHNLRNNIDHLRLWIRSTGPLLNVTYHISPADSEPGHRDGRYFLLDTLRAENRNIGPAGGEIGILHKGSRMIGNVLYVRAVLKWRIEFTARNGGWTQWLDLTRLDQGFRETVSVNHDGGRALWP